MGELWHLENLFWILVFLNFWLQLLSTLNRHVLSIAFLNLNLMKCICAPIVDEKACSRHPKGASSCPNRLPGPSRVPAAGSGASRSPGSSNLNRRSQSFNSIDKSKPLQYASGNDRGKLREELIIVPITTIHPVTLSERGNVFKKDGAGGSQCWTGASVFTFWIPTTWWHHWLRQMVLQTSPVLSLSGLLTHLHFSIPCELWWMPSGGGVDSL